MVCGCCGLFSLSRSTVVLLRHGEREDYMAEKALKGKEWVQSHPRPWDPALAPNGAAAGAAKRCDSNLLINLLTY